MRTFFGVVAAVLFGLAIYSFAVMIGDSSRLGGDALSGYVEDGRYYVSNHGRATEVSRDDWEASRRHAQTVFVTHPLGLVAMGYLLFAFIFPTFAGRRSADADARIASVRASGDARATARCGGRIGQLRLSGPLFRVSVHPGGLVLEPLFLGSRAILAAELASVRPSSSGLFRTLEIVHASPDVASPVVLAVAETSPLGEALRGLERGASNTAG